MREVVIFGIEGLPMIKAGDDLAKLVVSAAREEHVEVEDGDVLIVAQKVVSKAEDRVVDLGTVRPSIRAEEMAKTTGRDPRVLELVLRESTRFLKVSEETVVVEDQRGLVNIIAGIDKSNVKGVDAYALLPVNPDGSAERLSRRFAELTGKRVAVIISDTYSRPFRRGQVNFAIGLAGIDPFVDYRGKRDLFGYTMRVKFAAVADELAAAAELVMGQGDEAIPVVIARGLKWVGQSGQSSSRDLLIGETEDLFSHVL